MIVVFWVLNGLLALAFLASGTMKLMKSREELAASGMAWAPHFSAASVKAIGAAQVLGAIGLILPPLLNIAPILAPVASVGLLILMAGAVVVHIRRKEQFVPALALGVLALASAVVGFVVTAA